MSPLDKPSQRQFGKKLRQAVARFDKERQYEFDPDKFRLLRHDDDAEVDLANLYREHCSLPRNERTEHLVRVASVISGMDSELLRNGAAEALRAQVLLHLMTCAQTCSQKRKLALTEAENLFANVPTDLPQELVEVFAENKNVRIERIVSNGHASPENFWYDQEEHEWVVVLKGEAKLRFENDESVHMKPGDHVLIPAHRKHRVEWTTPEEPTVWLAVFYRE